MLEKVIADAKNKEQINEKIQENLKEEQNKITPLEEKKVTDIVTFSDGTDKIVIETVANFRNIYNYLATPLYKKRVLENDIFEIIPINYRLDDSPQFELIKNQTLKLIIDNKECTEITLDNLVEFFSRNAKLFGQIIEKINENSIGRGKGLKMLKL